MKVIRSIRQWIEGLPELMMVWLSGGAEMKNDFMRPSDDAPITQAVYDAIVEIRSKSSNMEYDSRIEWELETIHKKALLISHRKGFNEAEISLNDIKKADRMAYGSSDYNLKMAIKIARLIRVGCID